MPQSVRVLFLMLLGSCSMLVGCANMTHRPHGEHSHEHAPDCGHLAVRHASHVDYLHDGHMHHLHVDHVDDHEIPVSKSNPQGCTAQLSDHKHGQDCGHSRIPHDDHYDYVVDSRLHRSHDGHCDDHGLVKVVN